MRNLIWLASYPRSGNTYLRALLANALSDGSEKIPLNRLPELALGEHDEALWRDLTGVPAAERSLELEWSRRLDYFEALRARPGEGPIVVKVHAFNGSCSGLPAYRFEPGDRIVHLLRHPGDVAVSAAAYYGIPISESVDRLLTRGLYIDGRPQHGFEVLSSWADHALGWADETRVPVLTLRYADLVSAPAATLNAVLAFLERRVAPAKLMAAVDRTRFDRLKAEEAASGFAENASRGDPRFFREGRPFQWVEALPPAEAERLLGPLRPLLDRFGFTALERRRLGARAPFAGPGRRAGDRPERTTGRTASRASSPV